MAQEVLRMQESCSIYDIRPLGSPSRELSLLREPFYPYPTQVKLVLACCILHNWVLRHGHDVHVPPEDGWQPNPSAFPNDVTMDNGAWAAKRETWAAQMWQSRAGSRT